MTRTRVTFLDHLLGLALAAAYTTLLFATAPTLGMARDEGIYVIAANRYADWFELALAHPDEAFEPRVVDRHWEFNHEHPGLVKSLFAVSVLAQRKYELFAIASQVYRFPAMVLSGLTLYLVYLFGARTFGRQSGVFAALALGLAPQFFYHAHLACFDVPITFFATLATYAYYRSLEQRRWALVFGFTYGLALATKHNAWMLPGIFAIHFVWMAMREVRRRRRGMAASLRLFPYWLLGMGLVAPAVFVGTWPWLYHDAWPRFLEYARFHLGHEYYNMAYFGVNYYRPPFPISYPFVMTAFTVPMTTLVLALMAMTSRARAFLPWPLVRTGKAASSAATLDPRATDVLFVGCALAPIVAIALPSTPIFGGTKHWFPAYPFLAIYAGWAARRSVRYLRGSLRGRWPDASRAIRAAGFSLLLLPSLVETRSSHPFGLAHYTFGTSFTKGAADHGMNRQFWGYTTGSLGPFFREHLPDGGRVWICDMLPESFEMLKRDGVVPSGVAIAWAMSEADYAIVHHEHHFAEVDAQLFVAYGTTQPVYVLTHDGVPIISVYENPVHARRRRR